MARRKRPFTAENVAKEVAAETGESIDVDEVEETYVADEKGFSLHNDHYVVLRDDDSAYRAAVSYVKDMLEDDPSLFNQSWLMGHIDEEKLKKWVYDVEAESYYAEDLARRDTELFWEEYERWTGQDPPEEDTDEWDDPSYRAIEELTEAIAEDQAQDPMGYLEGIYGHDAPKKAMEIAGIDIDAAAEDAVSVDGWAHFLSDGDYQTTESGFVFWKGSGYR